MLLVNTATLAEVPLLASISYAQFLDIFFFSLLITIISFFFTLFFLFSENYLPLLIILSSNDTPIIAEYASNYFTNLFNCFSIDPDLN